jgi:microcystin-dependent protein
MADPFTAEIRMFAGNFAPKSWALCNGQLIPLSQNTALFALLGTFYGGDGKSTFALPDLQDSVPVHQGAGAGLTTRYLGEQAGSEFVTLLNSEIPVHQHTLMANATKNGVNPAPAADQILAKSSGGALYSTATSNLTLMNFQETAIAGSSLPHNNLMPYLVVTFIIALSGVFPPRQ